MAYVNVAEWSPRHVAEWLRGLDDVVQPYVQFFLNNNINGCHLLTLVSDDLTHLNVIKIGHQETILEAVELLRQLHYNLTSENLQSLALKLGCKARSLCNNLKHLNSTLAEKTKQELLSTETLSSVSDILGFVKILISWLDRYPFEGQDQYKAVRKSILRYSIELASTAQRDQFAEKPTEIIQNSCYNIAEQCDTIVQKFNDSLIIQPASLNVATVRKRADEDLGIHIHSSYSGIHIIGAIKFQSPAYRCGKISEGDEIIQVNYQTVVGWQLKNLVCATREHPSEIHLTVKKRPHHSSVLEEIKTIWPCRIPSKRTAFRRMNKWSKFNSTQLPISEIALSKSSSKQIDGLQEANNDNLYPLDGISQPSDQHKTLNGTFKHRSRINRRATIDSIPFIPKHSTLNVELERLAKTKTCNFSEKLTNSNVNKTGAPNNSACITLLQPIDYKFGSTDSDKWNIKNDKESLSSTADKKLPVTKYIETNLHQNSKGITSENGYSSDSNSSDISLKPKGRQDTKVHRFRSSKSIQNPSTSQIHILGQQSFQESVSKDVDFKNDTLVPVIKNEGNIKNIDMLFENEKEIVHHLSDKQNISNFNHAVNIQEKSPICLESDDKNNDTKFQVVSLPSPGINTRTFTRQNSSDKKLQHDSINLSSEEISKHNQIINDQQNSSTTDISGQSDSSLDEIIDHSKSVQKNTDKTNEKSEMTLKYQKLKSVEHINYKRAKNIQLRTQRRFTTDQAILPKHWEKIVNSERISAFKPVSGRSFSCIDVSETTHGSHNNDVNCIKPVLNNSYEIKVLKGGNYDMTNKKYMYPLSPTQSESAKDISWNKSHLQPFNSVNSLDRKISVPKYLDSCNAIKSKCDTIKEGQLNSYKDKRDSKPPGYVAKIAESFNILSRQEPSHFPSITQIYQPISSYATITKPKPLRGDQLVTLHQKIVCENKDYNHSNSSGSCLENNHIKSQIINEKKIVCEVKKDHIDSKQVNKFLRTATSEEIQNMYTSYGNSGRGFEAGQNFSLNSVIKEETISNPNVSKKAHIQSSKDVLNEQSPEYLCLS